MRLSLAVSLLPLAGFVGALHVTEPEQGADIPISGSLTVKWTFVDTDATSFDLYLTNYASYPPVSNKIATNVKTSDGSYTIDSLTGVSAGHGYQINLQSDVPMNTGILAQSQQFNITDSAQSSSSSSSSTSTSSSSSSSGTTTSSTTGSAITPTSTLISSTVLSGSATGSKTAATSGATGAASSTGASGNATTSQLPAPNGAGAAFVAHPVAAAGILAGALAFAL